VCGSRVVVVAIRDLSAIARLALDRPALARIDER
jgi:hypothetical protein